MSWFSLQPKMTVCLECGVYFAPHFDAYEGFNEYCRTHREDRVDRARRKRQVVEWAGKNWEKLEPQMQEAERQHREDMRRLMEGQSNAYYAQNKGDSLGLGGLGSWPEAKP